MTVFAGVIEGGAASRDRVAKLGPALLDVPRLFVVGEGNVGRARQGALCVIVGAVWNASSLAADAGLAGRGLSQSMLVAELFERFGLQVLDRLRGRYLVVLVNREQIVVSADAMGARSLHVSEDGGGVVFGEDVRDVIAGLAATPEPCRGAVASWIADGTVPVGRSLFRGVQRLPAGTGWLSQSKSTGALQAFHALRLPDSSALIRDPDEAATLVRSALRDAARRALGAVPQAGVMLSGGLDSSAIAASAVSAGADSSFRAVSAVFPDHPEADESELVRETASQLGLDLHVVSMGSPTETNLLLPWVEYAGRWKLPYPYAAGNMTQTILDSARSAGMRALLTGQGGDETSFNFPQPYLVDLLRSGRLREAWQLSVRAPFVPPGRREMVRTLWATTMWVRSERRPRSGPSDGRALLRVADAASVDQERKARTWTAGSGPYWWRHRHSMLTQIRELVDASGGLRRLGLSVGMDQVHPFLHDPDLFEAMLRLHPVALFDRRNDRIVTRKAMAGMLPEAVLDRRGKSHFTDLHTDWLSGAGRPAVDGLLASKSEWAAFCDAAVVQERLLAPGALAVHPGGRYGWAAEMHRLVALELWLRQLRD